jgi:hypothetical protein
MRNLDPRDISPKVILSTAAAILASAALASLQYLLTPEGQELFAALPPVVVVGLTALITGTVTALAGYLKTDPTRQPVPDQSESEVDPGSADGERNDAEGESDPAEADPADA